MMAEVLSLIVLFVTVTAVVQLSSGQQGEWTLIKYSNTHVVHAYTSITVYLSLGSINITTNNTEVQITDIGEDYPGHLPSLTCHTDLTECCRNSDTGGQGGRGEWSILMGGWFRIFLAHWLLEKVSTD